MDELKNENVTPETPETVKPESNNEIAQSTTAIGSTEALVQGVMHERNIQTVAKKQLAGKILVQVDLVIFLIPKLDFCRACQLTLRFCATIIMYRLKVQRAGESCPI